MDVEEIKARLQTADKETFWEDVNSNLVFEDIPALISEVERLTTKLTETTAERDALLKSFKVKPVGLEERGD